jgi:hypothetical protein
MEHSANSLNSQSRLTKSVYTNNPKFNRIKPSLELQWQIAIADNHDDCVFDANEWDIQKRCKSAYRRTDNSAALDAAECGSDAAGCARGHSQDAANPSGIVVGDDLSGVASRAANDRSHISPS